MEQWVTVRHVYPMADQAPQIIDEEQSQGSGVYWVTLRAID